MFERTLTRRTLMKSLGAGLVASTAPWLLASCVEESDSGESTETSDGDEEASNADDDEPSDDQAAEDERDGEQSEEVGSDERPTIRMSGGDFGFPSPFTFSRGPGHVNTSFVFDTLVWHDPDGIVPWLATDWEASADGTTWEFTLQDGVSWQDGEPFSADDIAFTLEYMAANPTSWWASAVELVESVEVESDASVTIEVTQAYAPFLTEIAAAVFIIPRHVWENVDDPVSYTEDDAAMGTGPFRFVEYSQGEGTYLFEANDDFFLGQPYVRRIEFVPAPNPILALQQDTIDAGGLDADEVATTDVLEEFENDSNFGVISAPREWNQALFFNMNESDVLADRSFRQAVAHALDLNAFIDRILHGEGEPGNPGHVAPTSPWHNPDVRQYEYDVEQAGNLLDEAGYEDSDGDGVRETEDGTALAFTLIFAGDNSLREAEMIQSQLSEVGIEIELQSMDRQSSDAAASEGRYELALLGFGGLGRDAEFLRNRFHSESASTSFTQVHGYHNPDIDELTTEQLAAIDREERQQIVDEIQEILAEDVPIISLYYPNDYWVYRQDKLDGWYFAAGWYGGGTNGSYKRLFVTGQQTGIEIAEQ